MVATAVMLSLAGAGGMDNAASYQPVWGMMLAQQLMVVVLVLSLPKGRAESGGNSTMQDTQEETEETNLLLGGEDDEDQREEQGERSIYAHVVRRGEATPSSTSLSAQQQPRWERRSRGCSQSGKSRVLPWY